MLEGIYKLEYELELLTGLHIGGSSDTFDIGGADATVIKNPLNHEPYIPGSSIKGKLKSLLTFRYSRIETSESSERIIISDNKIRNLFEPVEGESKVLLSRAVFRDAVLTKESREDLQRHLGAGNFTEIKAENSINLLKGKAANPRFIERVPAGAKFHGEIILQVFAGDDCEVYKKSIYEALKLLEMNYLGGNGTRGYGRVKIKENGFEKVKIGDENI